MSTQKHEEQDMHQGTHLAEVLYRSLYIRKTVGANYELGMFSNELSQATSQATGLKRCFHKR